MLMLMLMLMRRTNNSCADIDVLQAEESPNPVNYYSALP